jgi:hypothetical protein
MSRLTTLILLVLAFLSFSFSAGARAEEIKNFHSEISISRDGTLNVREEIEYDFQNAERHGIDRNIPYKY